MRLKNPTAFNAAVQDWGANGIDTKQSQWRRFSSTKALADTRNDLRKKGKIEPQEQDLLDRCVAALKKIKETETDKTLLMYYEMF